MTAADPRSPGRILFSYGYGSRFADVTQIVYDRFASGNRIVMRGIDYNEQFGDPAHGHRKCLRVVCAAAPARKPLYVAENAYFSMSADCESFDVSTSVNIVYFINVALSEGYAFMMISQLGALKATGLLELENVRFHAVVTGPAATRAVVTAQIAAIVPAAQVDYATENRFEYPGIHKVWEIAQRERNGLTLYFHAKGMSRQPSAQQARFRDEELIFKRVIGEWRENLRVFSQFDSINKVGASAGGIGWIWFNFWWARNSYLAECEEPILTSRRHYYEDWLGRRIGASSQKPGAKLVRKFGELFHRKPVEKPHAGYPVNRDDCYSICCGPTVGMYNIGTIYEPEWAIRLSATEPSG